MNDDLQNELLSAYLDGELTADQRAQVEHLLATKPAARKLLEELRALSATLKSLPQQKVGEDLSQIVLRTAEVRMQTEPADAEKTETDALAAKILEEKQEMGTGAAEEPAPIYSTIIRRLKNPRMWVWEMVIVAVAVMLLVYYPNQNARQNAPTVTRERNIAMATKPAEKSASDQKSSMRAASSPVKVEQMEALDVQIVRGKRADTSGRSGIAMSENRQAAPGSPARALSEPVAPSSPARALAEPVAPGTSAQAGKQSVAHDASALADKQPVATGEIAKKGATAYGEKLAGQDMPKVAHDEAKGVSTAGESAAPTSTPAPGFATQEQSKSGMAQITQNINASEAPMQNKPAEPPADKDYADRTKEKAAPADELIVVRCEITPEALKNHAFDKILAENAIVWSDAEKDAEKKYLDFKNLPSPETIQSLLGTATVNGVVSNKPQGAEQSIVAGNGIALPDKAPLELVYVEASPAKIQSMLNGLSAQSERFKTVSVAPATADSLVQSAAADYQYRGIMAKAAQKGQADLRLSMDSVQGGFQADSKSDLSTSGGAVLGRAQRIPFAQAYNAKAAGVETEAQKQNITSIGRKGLPATLGYGGGAGGRASESRLGGQLEAAPGAAPATDLGMTEQLKAPAQTTNQSAAKGVQAPAAAAATPLFTHPDQGQTIIQRDQPASAEKQAQSRQTAKQGQQSAAEQIQPDNESLRRNWQIQQSATAALPRMERVLFVLQVIDRKNASETAAEKVPEKAKNIVPADAAGVNTPATQANPPKP